ncbi:hypothetical protein Tco_0760147 [Tanacetum coccineum]
MRMEQYLTHTDYALWEVIVNGDVPATKEREGRLQGKKEEEANIALIESWENTQSMMEADRLLAERLQTREQEELTDEEKAKLFMEFMERRRKHFAALRAQEKRNKDLLPRHKREIKSVTEESSKGTKDELESNKSKKAESSEEKAKGSRKKILGKKRAGKEQQQESSKRQRMEDDKETDEHEEVEVDDEAELKKHLVIVKDDDIAIDAIPLATKPPVIIEYKIIKEGIIGHYQFIRADGSSKRYSSMISTLQDIDREDLQTLWKLVKAKHGDTRPEDEHKRVLWGDLKFMFEPDIKSNVWRNLQGYTLTIWKLYDSCGVHFVRFGNVHIFMLVEKRYPLTPITITNMLNKKLQTNYWNEMCYQLLKLMKMNIKFKGGWLGLKRLQGFLELLLLRNRSRIVINKWYQSFALRNFDLKDMEFEYANTNTTAKLPILKLVTKMFVPVTAKEKTNKKNDVKARRLLLMALPNEH